MTQLHEVASKIKSLLDEPAPGLLSWQTAIREQCKEMQRILCGLGCTPQACGIFVPELPDEIEQLGDAIYRDKYGNP